jgi:hypothetical protein
MPFVSTARIFASFDIEHDRDLYERLLAQSRIPSSGFTVSGGSAVGSLAGAGGEGVRRRICEADQVIVICGQHTEGSTRMGAELRMVQEERKPYFLLWGRREKMCTKPIGARPFEGMYSWTRQIVQDQITLTHRKAAADQVALSVRRR